MFNSIEFGSPLCLEEESYNTWFCPLSPDFDGSPSRQSRKRSRDEPYSPLPIPDKSPRIFPSLAPTERSPFFPFFSDSDATLSTPEMETLSLTSTCSLTENRLSNAIFPQPSRICTSGANTLPQTSTLPTSAQKSAEIVLELVRKFLEMYS